MNFTLGLFGFIMVGGSLFLFYLSHYRESFSLTGSRKLLLSLLCISGIGLFVLSCSFTIIPTAYTGVKTTFGQISSETVQNGFNFQIPFVQSVAKVNNKQQDIYFKDKIWCESSEQTPIYYAGITVTYQINPEKSSWIYANISNYKASLVSQGLVASAIKASSKLLATVDSTNRAKIEPLAQTSIQKSLDGKYGENTVIICKVVINDANFEDDYNAALANRQKTQIEYEQAQIENKKKEEAAKTDANVKLTNADASAKAKVIAARAESDANKLLNDSLSEDIFKQMFLDKWDGQFPKVVGSGDYIFDLSSLMPLAEEPKTQPVTEAKPTAEPTPEVKK